MINAIDKQSPDIARGVDQAYEARHDPADDDVLDVAGAGDQGMMFGYATRETDVKPDLFDHVLLPILPRDLFDERKLLKNFWSTRRGGLSSAGRWGIVG